MKDSIEWVRQNTVDEAADEILKQRKCSATEVKPYWVAKKLGVDPSGEIYDKVYDWQLRKETENQSAWIEVPVECEKSFREALDQSYAEALVNFHDAVRTAGAVIMHNAGLQVADANLRASRAVAARVDLSALCRKAEADRDAARANVGELQVELAEAQRREERLIGRIEQLAIDADSKTELAAKKTEQTGKVNTDLDLMVHALIHGAPDDDVEDDVANVETSQTADDNGDPTSGTDVTAGKDEPLFVGPVHAGNGHGKTPPAAEAGAQMSSGAEYG